MSNAPAITDNTNGQVKNKTQRVDAVQWLDDLAKSQRAVFEQHCANAEAAGEFVEIAEALRDALGLERSIVRVLVFRLRNLAETAREIPPRNPTTARFEEWADRIAKEAALAELALDQVKAATTQGRPIPSYMVPDEVRS